MRVRRGVVVLLVLGMLLTFGATITWPELVPPSLVYVWLVVSALFASAVDTAAVAVLASVLLVAHGAATESLGTGAFWIRLVAWIAASVLVVWGARDRARVLDQLEELATTDALTGVANRRILVDRLEAQLALRDRPGSLAVLFVDLDDFKAVNTEHGHAGGDAVLVAVARRLETCVRRGDTVARQGGDEFVIAAPDLVDTAAVEQLCRRVLEAVEEPVGWRGRTLRVGATVGAVVAPAGAWPALDDVVQAADDVMLAEKERAKGGYRILEIQPPVGR